MALLVSLLVATSTTIISIYVSPSILGVADQEDVVALDVKIRALNATISELESQLNSMQGFEGIPNSGVGDPDPVVGEGNNGDVNEGDEVPVGLPIQDVEEFGFLHITNDIAVRSLIVERTISRGNSIFQEGIYDFDSRNYLKAIETLELAKERYRSAQQEAEVILASLRILSAQSIGDLKEKYSDEVIIAQATVSHMEALVEIVRASMIVTNVAIDASNTKTATVDDGEVWKNRISDATRTLNEARGMMDESRWLAPEIAFRLAEAMSEIEAVSEKIDEMEMTLDFVGMYATYRVTREEIAGERESTFFDATVSYSFSSSGRVNASIEWVEFGIFSSPPEWAVIDLHSWEVVETTILDPIVPSVWGWMIPKDVGVGENIIISDPAGVSEGNYFLVGRERSVMVMGFRIVCNELSLIVDEKRTGTYCFEKDFGILVSGSARNILNDWTFEITETNFF